MCRALAGKNRQLHGQLEELRVTLEELRDPDLSFMGDVELVGWGCQGQVVGEACRRLMKRWRRMLAGQL